MAITRAVSLLLGLSVLVSSAGLQANQALLEQLKFTAVELLIYTDQLSKFDGTRCSKQAVSSYSLVATQQRLLSEIDETDRPTFQALFDSAQVSQLLAENSAGIEAMLGPQQLLSSGSMTEQQQQACRELAAVFQDNYLQTEQDWRRLLKRYRSGS